MKQTTSNITKEKLLTLPITLEGKVQLWLTYKGLKPVSTVQFLPEVTPLDKNDFFEWLSNSKLVYVPDQKSSEFVYVSAGLSQARKAMDIMWSDAREDLIQKGELFGYPKEAVLAFASGEKVVPVISQTFDYYWSAYVRYVVRPGFVMDDSQIAKKWADVIREDVPQLASAFEEEMKNMAIR